MVPYGGAGSPRGTPAEATSEEAPARPASPAALAICPYLVDTAGAWRRAQPSRSHRCGARSPAPTIPALTQKRVCLTSDHLTCEFYVAAASARDEALLADHVRVERLETSRFHVSTRPLPLATDGVPDLAGPLATASRVRSRRPPPGAIAVAGLVAALAIVAVAVSFLPPAAPGGIAGTSPTPGSAPVTPGLSAHPTTSSGASPAPTSAPSTRPTPGPGTSVSPTSEPTPSQPPRPRRYRVRGGDTLNRIAARFDTSVRAIQELNELREGEDIRVGQLLRIPSG